LDRLDHHGERDLARTALVDWTRAFTRQVAEWAISPDEEVWNDRVRDELPNLRAARAEMLRSRDVEAAITLSKDLNDWCQLRGVAEICQWSAELVDLTADIDRDGRAEALAMAAQSAWLLGRLDESRSLAESVLAGGGSMSARANALSALGAAAMFQGRLGDATAAWLARDEIDPDPIDLAAAALAAVYAGDRDRGDTLLVRAKAEAATRGAPSDRAWLEYITGEMAWYHGTGDHETHLRRAISLAQQVGTEFIEGVATVTLVSSRAREQHGATAATGFAELIELWLRTGSWTQLWTTLHNVAEFLVGKDDATALLLLEAARADPDAPTLPEPARGVEIDLRDAIVVRLGTTRAAEISVGATTTERGAVAETALTALRQLADQQR
jgi:tetratricopeptide (TPR) repeat protein